jgi:hypothetical protein
LGGAVRPLKQAFGMACIEPKHHILGGCGDGVLQYGTYPVRLWNLETVLVVGEQTTVIITIKSAERAGLLCEDCFALLCFAWGQSQGRRRSQSLLRAKGAPCLPASGPLTAGRTKCRNLYCCSPVARFFLTTSTGTDMRHSDHECQPPVLQCRATSHISDITTIGLLHTLTTSTRSLGAQENN